VIRSIAKFVASQGNGIIQSILSGSFLELIKWVTQWKKSRRLLLQLLGLLLSLFLCQNEPIRRNVIKSAGQAFSSALSVAVSPVTGGGGGGLGGNGFISPF
jgi:hypothetical protein